MTESSTANDVQASHEAAEPEAPDEIGVIGRDGDVLRALNFSGGGFDTVMQLGVIHALIVNRGVAPDAVVGISAGTIQAVALAEVMRSGARPEITKPRTSEEKRTFLQQYTELLGKRVAKFRKFVDACHRAPEEIVDSLLPDTYQIDSFAPLAPLDLPTFFKKERKERTEWLRRRSGLVRLYNALLALHIPVGTLARLIRRGLGIKAAGSIGRVGWRGTVLRGSVRFMEIVKAWIVIGDNLPRLMHIVGMVIMPLISPMFRLPAHGSHADNDDSGAEEHTERAPDIEPRSAGSIIFRFAITSRLWKWALDAISYLFLLNVWTGVTIVVLALPAFTALGDYDSPLDWLRLLPLLLYGLFLVPLTKSARHIDRQRRWQVVKDYLRGAFVLLYSCLKWLVVLMLMTALPILLLVISEGESFLQAGAGALFETLTNTESVVYSLVPAAMGVGFAVLLSLLFALSLITRFAGPAAKSVELLAVRRWLSAVVVVLTGTLAIAGTFVLIRIFAGEEIATFLLDLSLGERSSMFRVASAIVVVTVFAAILLALSTIVLVATLFTLREDDSAGFGKWYLRRFLDYYNVGPSIGHPYGLKQFLVRLFDRRYYGHSSVIYAADEVNRDGADDDQVRPVRRTIGEFARPAAGRSNIAVGIATANLESRRLEVMRPETGIVDALLAATALIPIYPPQRIRDSHHIDATNIGDVPTSALLRLLRQRKLAKIKSLHIYAVDPLPISRSTLSPPIDEHGKAKDTPYLNLIDTAVRALQLQRFRDGHVERRLTRVFTDVFPKGAPPQTIMKGGSPKQYFRAYIAPIELEKTISLNKKILLSTKEARRGALAETIAMGCRASLQVMLAETLEQEAEGGMPRERFIRCQDAVERHRRDLPDAKIELPGSGPDAPGLKEICKHCCITNDRGEILEDPVTGLEARKCLRLPGTAKHEVKVLLDWPHELDEGAKRVAGSDELTADGDDDSNADVGDETSAPARACLFGGGVFRGVFQVGVLNALALAEFRPTLLAGASVGSITAATVRAALTARDEQTQSAIIANMALTNLKVDHVVMTDRFADFIRNWTIRASETKFSVKQLDSVFRKFDEQHWLNFQRDVRLVLAGLERLFYIDPYQLNSIVMAARQRHYRRAGQLLAKSVQEWLDRMAVGREVLGAEPLRGLIDDFVLPPGRTLNGLSAPLNEPGAEARMLVTTTNLTQGALHILGTCRPVRANEKDPTLVEALLASSAFPGVFRPRQSWDLMPGDASDDEYVDGGIMDNLPLEPVIRELRALSELTDNPIELRPKAPHLIVAASLETEPKDFSDGNIGEAAHYWPEVSDRATELKYNRKLDLYVKATENIHLVYEAVKSESYRPPLWSTVLPVKPLWLCSTFGFHPMLGFRRVNQAKSIAHGCAATLVALRRRGSADTSKASDDRQEDPWKLNENVIPKLGNRDETDGSKARDIDKAREQLEARLARDRSRIPDGQCWLQQNKPCPFSRQELRKRKEDAAAEGPQSMRERVDLSEDSIHWISEIHRQCWRPIVHTPGALSGDGVMAGLKHFFKPSAGKPS